MDDVDERILLARERTLLANERSRLANERTFLAWTRTGLASVGGGLAVIRFLVFENVSHQMMSQMIGCLLVILGIAIFALSFFDYRNSCKKLKVQNSYAGSVWTICVISCVFIAISIIMLFITFVFSGIRSIPEQF